VQAFWSRGDLDPESNVQFGEGGAGTFSDGKLTTRVNDANIAYVLEKLVAFGAPPEILYQANLTLDRPAAARDCGHPAGVALRRVRDPFQYCVTDIISPRSGSTALW